MRCAIPTEGHYPGRVGERGVESRQARRDDPVHLADLKPEAVYFTDHDGQRAGYIFLEMQDASEIPGIAEPWFLAFNAAIEIHPVMRPEDLARAGGAIDKAVKKYGSN